MIDSDNFKEAVANGDTVLFGIEQICEKLCMSRSSFIRLRSIVDPVETTKKEEATASEGTNNKAETSKQEEKRHRQGNDIIKEKITIWVEHKGYLQLGVTIQDLSREIGINRTYLSNYINETYQSNFNGWLNDLRIEEAKQKIISSPEINLSDLAEMVGFADQAHFSKQFKQKEGIPPSVWKKEHRAKSEKD
jgi:YesN/AraC family two-component response regulator